MQKDGPGANMLESSLAEKSLLVLVTDELTMRLQCALMARKGQQHLGLHWQKCGQKVKGVDPSSQLSSGETHIERWVQCWTPSKRDTGTILEQVQ